MGTLGSQFDFWGGSVPLGSTRAAPPDTGLSNRLERQRRNAVDVVASTLRREEPTQDSIITKYFGLGQAKPEVVPKGVHFHEHPPAARLVGRRAEVPLQGLNTMQHNVSVDRHREILADPNAGASPRYPGSLMVDVPFVYRSRHGDDIVVDGNHRVTAAVARGEMFTPARVVGPEDVPKMRAATKRLNQRRADAGVSEFDRLNRYTVS